MSVFPNSDFVSFSNIRPEKRQKFHTVINKTVTLSLPVKENKSEFGLYVNPTRLPAVKIYDV